MDYVRYYIGCQTNPDLDQSTLCTSDTKAKEWYAEYRASLTAGRQVDPHAVMPDFVLFTMDSPSLHHNPPHLRVLIDENHLDEVEGDSCVFCKIIRGQVKAETVHETEYSLVIKDREPQAPVHFVVILKRHYKRMVDLVDLDKPFGGTLMRDMFEAIRPLMCNFPTGHRIVFNNGECAGQTVKHVHMHVLGGRDLGDIATPVKSL